MTVADIEDAFKEVHSDVDAVFTYEDHLYMIKVDWRTSTILFSILPLFSVITVTSVILLPTKVIFYYFLILQDDKLFVYQSGDDHTLLEGYPKSVKEELGVDGHIDAAFVCEDNHIVHIIKGEPITAVDKNDLQYMNTAFFKKQIQENMIVNSCISLYVPSSR